MSVSSEMATDIRKSVAQNMLVDADEQAEAIMASAKRASDKILSDAKSQAAKLRRLAKMRAAEVALDYSTNRYSLITVCAGSGEGKFYPPSAQAYWYSSYQLKVDMTNRRVVWASVPNWPSKNYPSVAKVRAEAVLFSAGDILPADSKEWETALGLR